jgi:hypothetical protein
MFEHDSFKKARSHTALLEIERVKKQTDLAVLQLLLFNFDRERLGEFEIIPLGSPPNGE